MSDGDGMDISSRVSGYHLSSVCCQAHVGASGYVLFCLALNDRVGQGRWFPDHLPRIEGSWVCELG
jgi:hypothetical protein